MAIPQSVLAAGWVPFVVVFVLTLFFAFFYVRYFQSKYESEVCSSLTAMAGIVVVLLITALVPVDIFLVAFMKDASGHFKPWAVTNETRVELENDILYGYYALWACVMLFVFILLPFAYFFYEEADEERSSGKRLCTALKYTLVFIFVAIVLLVIGAFAPIKHIPPSNVTDMERIEFIFKDTRSDLYLYGSWYTKYKIYLEDALSFAISSVTLIGMLVAIIYTGYGMSAWPMDLVKGRRSASKEKEEVSERRHQTQQEIDTIRTRGSGNHTGRVSSRDRRRLEELEERERFMARREHHLGEAERSCVAKCLVVLRPFQVVFGVLFFLMELLVFTSLLITNIDKILHSQGWVVGYALPERKLPNPIDMVLVYAQKVFPLDYTLMTAIIIYFVFCSMGGVQHMGIWCCWMRMYKIRVRRTKPQGLLFMCFLLMFIMLALNIIVYEVTPQYSTFGSQKYVVHVNETVGNHTEIIDHVLPCTTKASPDECVMTRMSMLLLRFFYKARFFGAAYYFLSWAFLLIIVLGFLVSLCKKRRSSIEGAVDREDFDSDDENLINA